MMGNVMFWGQIKITVSVNLEVLFYLNGDSQYLDKV